MVGAVAEGASTGCWAVVQQLEDEAPSEEGHSDHESVSSSPLSPTDSFSLTALLFLKKCETREVTNFLDQIKGHLNQQEC